MSPTSAETIAHALGGQRVGASWLARCPAHTDRTPSLAICDSDDGRVLFKCHAGCAQRAVLDALRKIGLWPTRFGGPGLRPRSPSAKDAKSVCRSPSESDKARVAAAMQIWAKSKSSPGTLVEIYLRSRGLRLPPGEVLRFSPDLRHPTGQQFPAMVALVTDGATNRPIGVHRTFIAADGIGKANIRPNKMMLGPCRGGAVRLGPLTSPLLVAEGIETALAGLQATGHTAWAALSSSGLAALTLPNDATELVILADGDPAGERAASTAAQRWRQDGRRVRIAHAPEGSDFHDVFIAEKGRYAEGDHE